MLTLGKSEYQGRVIWLNKCRWCLRITYVLEWIVCCIGLKSIVLASNHVRYSVTRQRGGNFKLKEMSKKWGNVPPAPSAPLEKTRRFGCVQRPKREKFGGWNTQRHTTSPTYGSKGIVSQEILHDHEAHSRTLYWIHLCWAYLLQLARCERVLC